MPNGSMEGTLLSMLPVWFWWVVLLVLCWPPLAWLAIQRRGSLAYRGCILLMLTLAAALPWMAASTAPGVRFFLLLPSLLLMVKTWEVVVNKPRKAVFFSGYPSLFFWSVFVPEGERSPDREVRRRVRAQAGPVGIRMVLKFGLALLLFALNDGVELHTHWPVQVTWMAFTLYFCLGAALDAYAFVSCLLGIEQPAFFDAPPLARNPRDFWGRRWNLWFTQTTHRLIFQPLGGVERPVFAASGVFVFSALLHEYMVVVSLERFDGRMILFFLLHGLATILFTAFSKGVGRSWAIPRVAAVSMHFVWFIATAPLFFGPVDDIFGMHAWGLGTVLAWMGF